MATLDRSNTSLTGAIYVGLRYSNSYYYPTFTFRPQVTGSRTEFHGYFTKMGSPTGNLVVKIYDTSAVPGNLLATSNSVDIATASIPVDNVVTPREITFTFASPATLTAGTDYRVVFETDYTVSTTNYVGVVCNQVGDTNQGNTKQYTNAWGLNQNGTGYYEVFKDYYTPANGITLTDITEGRIFQRNSSNQADIVISGTYIGTPTSIQARVVQDGTSTEVVGWTTIVASPAGGTFSGTLSSVPQGGWYNVQVRFSNETSVVSNGTQKWGIGILVGCIGQSNMYHWFWQSTDLTANSLLRRYDDAGWGIETHNGAISFGNTLISQVGVPVGLVNYAVGATGLLQYADKYSLGYWLDTTAGSIYNLFKAGVTAIGGMLEYVLFNQGENEGRTLATTKADYQNGLTTLISWIRSDITSGKHAILPFIYTITGRDASSYDAQLEIVRDAQYTYSGTAVYQAAHIFDLPQTDGTHLTGPGYTVMGQRYAQVVLYLLGLADYYAGPHIDSVVQIDNQTVDVTITHTDGTDFTPTSGITGFTVYDSGSLETITSAVRTSANTIRLTISGTITGTLTVRYMYGKSPVNTSPVIDNSSLSLPLDWSNVVTPFVETPEYTPKVWMF